jgi:hypothetical protein
MTFVMKPSRRCPYPSLPDDYGLEDQESVDRAFAVVQIVITDQNRSPSGTASPGCGGGFFQQLQLYQKLEIAN